MTQGENRMRTKTILIATITAKKNFEEMRVKAEEE
jgi:hypothetical protein